MINLIRETGFTIFEALLVLLVAILIGAASASFYHAHSISSGKAIKTASAAQAPKNGKLYIKGWNVSFKYDDSAASLVASDATMTSAAVTVTSTQLLQAYPADCTVDSSAAAASTTLGKILRGRPTDTWSVTDGVTTTYQQVYNHLAPSGAVKFGDYIYVPREPQDACVIQPPASQNVTNLFAQERAAFDSLFN